MTNKRIIIGKGLESVWFGLSRDAVRDLLGDPESSEQELGDGADAAPQIWWQYPSEGLVLGFSLEDEFVLSSMIVSSKEFTVNGLDLMEGERGEVLEAMSKLGIETESITEPDKKDTSELAGVAVVSFKNPPVNLWFKSEILKVIQNVPFLNDDQTILWPTEKDAPSENSS